jgi:hypothetical protein
MVLPDGGIYEIAMFLGNPFVEPMETTLDLLGSHREKH